MTENTKKCPQCSALLPPDAPEGLCPACLLQNGFRTEPAADAEPEDAAITPEIERLFPELELLKCLGQGGMGVVYKARQKQLDRMVAVKVMRVNGAKDPAFAERFTREARALAKLDHENIVSIHDFGQTEGRFFLIMEYVDGANLRQAIRTRSVEPGEALEIVPKICQALQFAHDQGVVHRDIKPENILISRGGRVKIADFGLAKMMGPGERGDTLTQEGMTMGTPRYMAPEQMDNPQEVDHRADIYSLGVVFYELLTGEVPMGRFAPPSQKVEVDVRLDEVVLRSLAREPELRFQNVSEVRTEVETIVRDPVAHSAPADGPPRLSGAALWGAGLVTMSLCFAAACVSLATRNFTISEWWFFLMLCVSTGVSGSACATAAVYEIKNSQGRVRGLRIAAAAAIGFPLIVVGGALSLALDPVDAKTAVAIVAIAGWIWWQKICDGMDAEVEEAKPRCSKTAIVGVMLGGVGLLTALRLLRSAGDPNLAISAGGDEMTLRRLVLSVVVGGAAAVSPLLGWMAIRDIRQSDGQLTGLWIARTAMLLFPLLLLASMGIVVAAAVGHKMGSGWSGEAAMLVGICGVGIAAWLIIRKTGQFAKGAEMPGMTVAVMAYVFIVAVLVVWNLYWPIVEWVILQIHSMTGS